MPEPLFVGIDVSSRENRVHLLNSAGTCLSKFSVLNNQPGALTLSANIARAMEAYKLDSLVIGLEATSVYGEPLVYFLRQDTAVSRFKPCVHVLNPIFTVLSHRSC